jgi:cytochrome c553
MLIITPPRRTRRPSDMALAWAAREAATAPPHLTAVLLAIASCADCRGRGARISIAELSRAAGKHTRQISRDLDTLRDLGLIRAGDPRHAPGRPGMGGPAVYELAMHTAAPRP